MEAEGHIDCVLARAGRGDMQLHLPEADSMQILQFATEEALKQHLIQSVPVPGSIGGESGVSIQALLTVFLNAFPLRILAFVFDLVLAVLVAQLVSRPLLMASTDSRWWIESLLVRE